MADQPDDRPTLSQQREAVDLAYLNYKGSVDILRGLVQKRKRSPEELKLAELRLPPLRQAVLTMRFVEANAETIRNLITDKGASGDAGKEPPAAVERRTEQTQGNGGDLF